MPTLSALPIHCERESLCVRACVCVTDGFPPKQPAVQNIVAFVAENLCKWSKWICVAHYLRFSLKPQSFIPSIITKRPIIYLEKFCFMEQKTKQTHERNIKNTNKLSFICRVIKSLQGLVLLTLSYDKNWDSHSLVNGYPTFYPRIALVAPSPGFCRQLPYHVVIACFQLSISGSIDDDVEGAFVAFLALADQTANNLDFCRVSLIKVIQETSSLWGSWKIIGHLFYTVTLCPLIPNAISELNLSHNPGAHKSGQKR